MSVVADGLLAQFVPDSGLLHATEGHGQVQDGMRIDPDGAGSKVADEPVRLGLR